MAAVYQHLPEVVSTNVLLKQMAQEQSLPHGYCLSVDFQTAGQGQGGAHWESAKSENLLFSLLLHPHKIAPAEQFLLSQIVSIALCEALREYIPEVKIKWPNDIYIGHKKLCGILIQTQLQSQSMTHAIIGIGLNVNQDIFRSAAPNPISLKQVAGREFDRDALLAVLVEAILNEYDAYQEEDKMQLRHRYFELLYRNDGLFPYTSEGNKFFACIDDILPTGQLCLRKEDGEIVTFGFKEVVFEHF